MKYKNLFLTILSCCLFASTAIKAIPDFLKPPPGATLSTDEQAAMEQTQQLYDLITKDMPPEARAEFDKAASGQYERLSQMSPEELEKEQQQVFSDLENALSDMEKKEEPKVEAPQPIAPVVPTPAPKPRKPLEKIDEIKNIVNTIIKRLDGVFIKTGRLLKLSQRITKWAGQRQLSPWKPGLTWDGLKGDMQTFKQRLIKMKTHDKQRAYFDDIIDNKVLYSDLERLSDKLNMLESQFVVTDVLSLDKQDLSSSSKQALKAILNNMLEALYTQNLTQALDVVIAKYDPEAEKLRKAKEIETEKAKKYAPRPGPTVRSYDRAPSYPSYDSGPSYGGGYSGGYPSARRPSTSYARQQPSDRSTSRARGATQPTRRGTQASAAQTKDDAKKEKYIHAPREDQRGMRLVGEVSNLLGDLTDIIEETPALSDIHNHITSATPPNIDTVRKLRELYRKLKRAKSKLRFLSRKRSKQAEQDLKEVVDEHKETLDNFNRQVAAALTDPGVNANKQYAYFGNLEEGDAATQGAIPNPIDVRTISREIIKFYEEARKITQGAKVKTS